MTGAGSWDGEDAWIDHLGNLRHHVRQELVTRQLRAHLPPVPATVLDIGCGQGTQTLELARRGYEIVAVDASERLLSVLRDSLKSKNRLAERIVAINGDLRALSELVGDRTFDIVLCHGVLMYFDDPELVLDLLAERVAPAGILSLLVRNRDSLAMRPGTAGRWSETLAAFDATTYVNRLGVPARADRLDNLRASLEERGLFLSAWYGVRLFTDNADADEAMPSRVELIALMAAEERAGNTEPYRSVAPLLHLVAGPTGA